MIAEGQYNTYTLKDALVTALNAGRTITGQYTVSYDEPTNKFTIGNLDNVATFHIYPPNGQNRMRQPGIITQVRPQYRKFQQRV